MARPEDFRWAAPWLVASLLLAASPARAADPEDAFATCERRFAENPQAEFACGCFYSLGSRQPQQIERVERRLAELIGGYRENPCLSFTLGRLARLRRQPAAEQLLATAAAGYARRDMAEGETYARLNLVDLRSDRGDEPGAEQELDRAAQAASRAAAIPGKAYLPVEVKVRRARLWRRRGEDLEKVEALLREAERSFPDAHDSLQRDILQFLGEVLHQLGRQDAAEATYRRMIEVTQGKNWSGKSDVYGEAGARQNLAGAYLARRPNPANIAAATVRFEEALAAAVAGGNLPAEAEVRRLLGRLEGGEAGRREIEKSIELGRRLEDPFTLRLGLGALAAEIAESEPERAAALLAEARRVEIAGEAGDLLIYGWFDRLAAGWATLGREEAIRGALGELVEIEEQRARQRDSLTRAEMFSVWADAYSWLAGRLLEAGEAGRAFELLERRHARVLLEVAGNPSEESFASLAEVQAGLAADQALFYFQQAYQRDFFGDFAGGSWLLAITRDAARIYPTADPLELGPLLPSLAGKLADPAADATAAAARVGAGLFGEALGQLPAGVRRLVVVPDESLQLLPFGALRLAPEGRPLAESFEIAALPSATLWRRWLRRTRPGAPAALVLADPEPGAAPRPLERLPAARREGRGVLRELGGESRLWLGPDAGEAPLRAADLAPFGVLHFAAHAVHGLPGSRAERSALVLSAGAGEDGLLRPGEIRGLSLGGKAVMLATCRGADGEVLEGEGALSLASAFFAAGAEVVVASLWDLGDRPAARFHQDFYRHLARGERAGEAFAAAQRELIAGGRPPAEWAGLVLLGNGDFRLAPAPPRAPDWQLPALLLAIAAAAALVMRARRKPS